MIDFFNVENYRENNRIEAKKSLGGLPKSLWETYSAFANTLGGVILLGVEEYRDRSLHAVNLPDPEGLIAEFWNIVKDPLRVSANILPEDAVTMIELNGNNIIAIEVPAAKESQRPVYIGNNPYEGTYVRNGDGDYQCGWEEVRDMQRIADGLKPQENK